MGFHEFSSPYDWSRIAAYKRTAKAAFGGMIDLSVGSPVDPVPDSVRKALAAAANDPNAYGYPATAGTADLRTAIAEWFSATRNVDLQAIHADAPKALFEACVQSNVQRVIQISALGAGGRDDLAYMRTKGEADAHLQSLPLNACIFRPSVVYGHDGESATMFRRLAALPVLVVPGRGEAMLQPVHIDDLCAAVVRAVAGEASHDIVHAVGPQAMTYREMIACYRAQGHSRAAWVVPMPWVLMGCVAAIAQYVPSSPLEPDTLTMLRAGSVADAEPFERLVGHALRHPNTFLMG